MRTRTTVGAAMAATVVGGLLLASGAVAVPNDGEPGRNGTGAGTCAEAGVNPGTGQRMGPGMGAGMGWGMGSEGDEEQAAG